MPTTIGVQLTQYAGTATTMTIELLAAGVLLNTGGDTLEETEAATGYFLAEVEEDLVTDYNAIIKSNGVAVAEGYLHLGQTVVDREAPIDLTSVLTAISELNTSGPGAIAKEVVISDGDSALSGAELWVTTDIEGINVIAGTLITNSLGKATFMLDVGVYYLWIQKSGYNFNNPNLLEVE